MAGFRIAVNENSTRKDEKGIYAGREEQSWAGHKIVRCKSRSVTPRLNCPVAAIVIITLSAVHVYAIKMGTLTSIGSRLLYFRTCAHAQICYGKMRNIVIITARYTHSAEQQYDYSLHRLYSAWAFFIYICMCVYKCNIFVYSKGNGKYIRYSCSAPHV